jgi:hypothetical protein
MWKLVAACLALSSLTLDASAEEIGRAKVNGKTVILDANGTWTYAEAGGSGAPVELACDGGNKVSVKKIPMEFCFANGWQKAEASDSFDVKGFNKELDIYVGAVIERSPIGKKTLRNAIIKNAANVTKVGESEIPVIKEANVSVNGQDWNYIEYDVTFEGAQYRFGNYYASLGERGAVQVVFWCAKAYFEESKPSIDEMFKNVVLRQ